ncbi:MAG: YbjN domain-containing protein [Lachnospiraceae bacterium]|nr:YbjN domain-containing protein [Lachnospiraceae bacterium]
MNQIIRNFKRFLDNHGFRYQTVPDNNNIVVIRNALDKHSSVLMTIIVSSDDDTSNVIQITAGGLGDIDEATYESMTMLNELNSYYRWFKIYTDDNGRIILSSDFLAGEDSNELIMSLIARVLDIADDCYPKIMRCLWG